MVSEELESELNKLRSNADSLAECLGSLLKRIEELEEAAANTSVNTTSSTISNKAANSKTASLLCKVAAAINNNASIDLSFEDDNNEVSFGYFF